MPNHALPKRAAFVGPQCAVSCDVSADVIARYLNALADWGNDQHRPIVEVPASAALDVRSADEDEG